MARILILDAIHGGAVLAQRMAALGHSVTCADVYGKASGETMRSISEAGASAAAVVPRRHFDLVMMPVHCPDAFLEGVTWDERITFHEAVGRLIDDGRFRIEVTGVKGKTGTCGVIAHVLHRSGMSVMLHTSRAYGPWENGGHREDGRMSIAPTSLLRLPEGKYDVIVCEVSLGGSGKADIAVITNILDDYGIAAGTKKASDAKSSILCGGTNIVARNESEYWKRYGKDLREYGGRIRILGTDGIGGEIRTEIDYKGCHEISIGKGYLAQEYIGAMEAALEVFCAMDIPAEAVLEGLRSFRGVPGRGEIRTDGNKMTVRERNPGISHLSVDHTLRCIKDCGFRGRALAVLDPVSKKVCDAVDMEMIRAAADRHGIPMVISGEPYTPEDYDLIIEFIKEGYQ